MASQRFCLRWNNHQTNLLSVFDQLLIAETFTDVTLAVEGKYLKAHKMVLSACSPYFQNLFLNHPEIHPIVILKDIPYADIKSLLDFMYRGEVSVDQERLTAFLRIAETLKIKGLTEVHEDKPVSATSTPAAASPNLQQINPYISQQQQTQQQQQQHQLQQRQEQQRKQQGMAMHNPLLGSALTGPKRKRGRPRKFSGSDMGDEYEEYERENLVQGSPELMEMRMGTDGFTTDDNGISRSGDNDDSNDGMDTSEAMHKTTKDQRKDENTSDSNHQQQQPTQNFGVPKNSSDTSSSSTNNNNLTSQKSQHHHNLLMQHHQQQQQLLQLQQFQQQHKSPPGLSSPKIRVNPNTQNPTTSHVSNVLQQLQNDTFNNNNNSNSSNNNNPQMTSLLENKSNTSSNASNGLLSALQLTAVSGASTNSSSTIHGLLSTPARMQNLSSQWLTSPGSTTTNNSSPADAKSQSELLQSIGLMNVNASQSSMDVNNSPTSGGGSLRPPMRRRVRRKGSSPDDQAEHLTEMSVRGLNLFRYASICDGVYQCTECLKDNVQKTFKNKYSFQRHAFLYHEGTQRKVFPCPVCGKEFSRPDKMKNHMKTTHESYLTKEFPINLMAAVDGSGGQQQQPLQKSNSPIKITKVTPQIVSSENILALAQNQIQLHQIQAQLQIRMQQQNQCHTLSLSSITAQPSQAQSPKMDTTPPSQPSPCESPLLVPKTEDLTIDLDRSSSPLPFNDHATDDDLLDTPRSASLPPQLQAEQENVA